ncbi:AbrB/MazE/SpoVT family DNA-binding domain-containing protein [Duganella vulcania]|uniref:AbrB/MazE/SpoVT family DNA-binding domain-containing protein n=1 Tax=Duganella vulcania TaxID=2692166 RepID=A0A845GGJ8_9BURK|nr:hypothetical protein [Duganella vulcania]MYM92542.1 hypothetical protein [Duganella vulcania]
MKLRKVGNSLGVTFTKETLASAGFAEGQELEIQASHGQIKIVPAVASGVVVSFTPAEAKALANGKMETKVGQAALNKVRRGIDAS